MLLTFEQGIRGGITEAIHKYTSANNKYMGDRFNPKSESSYLHVNKQWKHSIRLGNVPTSSNWRI